MRMIKLLTRSAALGLALSAASAGTAAAQVTANAACNGVVLTCDRVEFTFSSTTAASFTNIVINNNNANLPFRDDNTDPVGGVPFQFGEVNFAGAPFGLPWYGELTGSPGAEAWVGDPLINAFFRTDVVTEFILTLYFDPVGSPTLGAGDFSFVVEGNTEFDDSGTPILFQGNVAVGSVPPPSVVPEPATVLLLGSGLAGLGVVGIRRRRQGVAG